MKLKFVAASIVATIGAGLAFSAASQQPVPLLDNSATSNTAKASAMPSTVEGLAAATIVSRYGKVLSQRLVGAGGLTAWTVEKNGKQVVLYTTPDVQVLFTGIVWDASTGRNISDQFLPKVAALPASVSQPPATTQINSALTAATVGAMDGKFTGSIPEAIKTVDSLAGFKEGKGGIADTVYIIIDPRCPYCRKAYSSTREYVKNGRTIKWIPAVALGDAATGAPLVATILQSKDKDAVDRVLGKHEQISTKPTKESIASMETSLAFLFAAFEQNGGQQAGVPVAFFIDHRTGKPRMLTGVSEAVVLQDIFGKL